MKTKRNYVQPSNFVVPLQMKNQLLSGSSVITSERNGYTDGGEENWARVFEDYDDTWDNAE